MIVKNLIFINQCTHGRLPDFDTFELYVCDFCHVKDRSYKMLIGYDKINYLKAYFKTTMSTENTGKRKIYQKRFI